MRVLRRRNRCQGEQGAFIIVWALLLVGLLTMVAIVIDLGQARAERRTDQSIADFAALAASNQLSSSPSSACQDAWAYIQNNAPGLPSGASMPCNQFIPGCPNSPNSVPATGTGPYTITFEYPVSDAEISDSRFTPNGSGYGLGPNDGSTCQRFKVTVARTRNSMFAGIVNEFQRTAHASAVMRLTPGQTKNVPSLWLLDPTGCIAMDVSGGSHVFVGQQGVPSNPDPSLQKTIPGLITVDSDGSTCGVKKTVNIGGSGTEVWAIPTSGDPSGSISLFSLPAGTDCSTAPNACNQGDVNSGRLQPVPVSRSERATRTPLDWTYNCKSASDPSALSYVLPAPGSTTAYPKYHSVVTIGDCPIPTDRTTPPYIDQLRAYVTDTSGYVPAGFQKWTTSTLVTIDGVIPLPIGGSRCNPNGVVIALPANYVVDCPGGFKASGSGQNAGQVWIQGGNVVFDGPVSISGNGYLTVNGLLDGSMPPSPSNLTGACAGSFDPTTGDVITPPVLCPTYSSAHAAYVYMRSGDLSMNGGNLALNNTVLYQSSGALKITAGAPPRWFAPTEGAFNKLALWSEQSASYTLNGGGNLQLQGVFFAPEADAFNLTGNGNFPSLHAQFIAYHLNVSGGGVLTLVPDPTVNIKAPDVGGTLIR